MPDDLKKYAPRFEEEKDGEILVDYNYYSATIMEGEHEKPKRYCLYREDFYSLTPEMKKYSVYNR